MRWRPAYFPPGCMWSGMFTPPRWQCGRGIALHVDELEPDLILMCTHGRGGLRGLLYGRIAHQVVRLGTTPVLLVHPAGDRTDHPFLCRRLLVTLDGNPAHEAG